MARVTTDDVKEIFETNLTDLTAFITAANLFVEDKLGNTTLDETTLTEIERWVAAHFTAIRDPRAKTKKIGDASETYFGDTGQKEGLNSTFYGQQAILLDSTGTLSRAGKKSFTFSVLLDASD